LPLSDMPCQRIVEGERVVHCANLAEIDSPVAREGAPSLVFALLSLVPLLFFGSKGDLPRIEKAKIRL